jgi:zinc protease
MKLWMKMGLGTCLALLLMLARADDGLPFWEQFDYPPINNFDMPEIEIFELDNGIRFYLVEDSELPLISVNVMVRTGGAIVPDDQVGLNSLVGTVMRTGGSEQYPGSELDELLADRAAIMETSIGFSSGTASMNVLSEDFEDLLPVFIDLLQRPRFPQERIDLAVLQERTSIARRNDSQNSVAGREFQRVIYGDGSRYARRVEHASLDNISRDDIVDFHRRSFVGHNMMIGVVGDFSIERIRPLLEAQFGQIEAGEVIELPFPPVEYDFVSSVNFVDLPNVNQSYVLLGHIGGMRDNPDYAALQVMNRVLSGGFSSRLMQVVRSELGLAYAVFGSYGSGQYFPGTFTAGVMTASETTAVAIEAIITQIERLRNEPISEQELSQTRDQFLNSLVFQYTSRGAVLRERMSNDYAGLPPDTFERLVEEVREVSIEDVQRVAAEYLQPDALQILVVGNAEEVGDQLQRFGEVRELDISIPPPAQ